MKATRVDVEREGDRFGRPRLPDRRLTGATSAVV
jgi:hypothetical protein